MVVFQFTLLKTTIIKIPIHTFFCILQLCCSKDTKESIDILMMKALKTKTTKATI